MDSAYLGTIVPFAGNFAPSGWALCNGQLLSINGNEALFTLFGTTYGGDGITNFGLPDMRQRFPLGCAMGGTGDQSYPRGAKGGSFTQTITSANIPAHNHTMPTMNLPTGTYKVSSAPGNVASPAGAKLATAPSPFLPYTDTAPTVPLPSATGTFTVPVSIAGQGTTTTVTTQPPFLAMNFICCTMGIYPVRQ